MSTKLTAQGKIIIIVIALAAIIAGYFVITLSMKEKEISTLVAITSADTDLSEIKGTLYLDLKNSYDKEISRSKGNIKKAEDIAQHYPNDKRPRQNIQKWEEHIKECKKKFFSRAVGILAPQENTTFAGKSYSELKEEVSEKIQFANTQIDLLKNIEKEFSDSRIKTNIQQWKNLIELYKKNFLNKCLEVLTPPKATAFLSNSYSELKEEVSEKIQFANTQIDLLKNIEKEFSDSRIKTNIQQWKNLIELYKKNFLDKCLEILTPPEEINISGSTIQDMKNAFRNKKLFARKQRYILQSLAKENPDDSRFQEKFPEWDTWVKRIEDYSCACPEHNNLCQECISTEMDCKACNGKGSWAGDWTGMLWDCKLCNKTGKVYAPGKKFCPTCDGRWNKGVDCTVCNKGRRGLVNCTHCQDGKVKCPQCGTVDGKFLGKDLR